MKLSHSVGLKGINKKADVKLVQEALNRATKEAPLITSRTQALIKTKMAISH
ncbi:hypothetical protein NB545_14045 [Vibrio campbellii]|uniref:hypothetical protein n=1 Tax=Vibrio campbellii TaxID=680 RepID=UPI00215C5EB3|nr:hypothetical protein [Vibrio campbellii]MCR9908569.1 hypothetical protein [Vibrio campbellii]